MADLAGMHRTINALRAKKGDPEYSIIDWIRIQGPYIDHFHLHNNDGNKDMHNPVTEGTMDMEAVLAAVYLDGGMEAARGVIERCWPGEDEVARPLQDAKGALQEMLQKDGGDSPTYEIVGQSGPPHAPVFRAAVFWNKQLLAEGEGKTKKAAEQAAALKALEIMHNS